LRRWRPGVTGETVPAGDRRHRGPALYAVEIARSVVRDLHGQLIPEAVLAAFERLIDEDGPLVRHPLSGLALTRSLAGKYRWKLGDQQSPWRVIYLVDEDQWAVQVLAIGHRSEIYRRRL